MTGGLGGIGAVSSRISALTGQFGAFGATHEATLSAGVGVLPSATVTAPDPAGFDPFGALYQQALATRTPAATATVSAPSAAPGYATHAGLGAIAPTRSLAVGTPSTSSASAQSAGAAVAQAALSQLGVPYEFAAERPGEAFDCSGLTKWAWAQAGVELPHYSVAQHESLPAVPVDQLQPGDLLFFGSPIHHVGIYIGNGQMVHAPKTGDVVKIGPAFRDDLVGAARPVAPTSAMAGAGVGGITAANVKGPGEYGKMPVPAELAPYGNGQIPEARLAPVGQGSHRLYAPAAAAWQQVVAAAAADGIELGITDSYRSYAEQVDLAERKGLYSQGGLAAVPGTSNHGWGLAVDADVNDPATYAWMQQNAARFGFVEAVPREPWHWEYRPAGWGS